jgi:hypothetical protein
MSCTCAYCTADLTMVIYEIRLMEIKFIGNNEITKKYKYPPFVTSSLTENGMPKVVRN